MKLLSITTALAAASVASANLVARNGATLSRDITSIAAQLQTLDNSLRAFSGGTAQALVIQAQTSSLRNKIQQGDSDAKASAALSDTESAQVAQGVTDLQANIYDVLSLLIAKKPLFDKAILNFASASSLVLTDLKNLKTDTDSFGADVIAKLVPVLAKVAPLVTSDIDFHYQQAINAYS